MATTLVFLHAHPDDEALLTAGTMARAALAGHRVILVVATAGEAGLSAQDDRADGLLGQRRLGELARSAELLGVARTECLGYPDSGLHAEVDDGLAHRPPGEVADRVAGLLSGEKVDVLVTYDPAGGYGHPDHLAVHAVGIELAERLDPAAVYEATLPREPIARAVRLAGRLGLTPSDFDPTSFDRAFTPRAQITHRVDVRAVMDRKRASLRAHATQAGADGALRTLGVLGRLPGPVLSGLMGTEYYRRVRHQG